MQIPKMQYGDRVIYMHLDTSEGSENGRPLRPERERAWKALLAAAARKPGGILTQGEVCDINCAVSERERRKYHGTLVWLGVKRGGPNCDASVDRIVKVPNTEAYSEGIGFILGESFRSMEQGTKD